MEGNSEPDEWNSEESDSEDTQGPFFKRYRRWREASEHTAKSPGMSRRALRPETKSTESPQS